LAKSYQYTYQLHLKRSIVAAAQLVTWPRVTSTLTNSI